MVSVTSLNTTQIGQFIKLSLTFFLFWAQLFLEH